MQQLQEGDAAPEFNLPGDQGQVSLRSLKGRPFVLYFYPKDDTSGCTKEAIDFSTKAGEFRAVGVEIIGISKDSVASHAKFRAKYDLGIRLASDIEKAVAELYGVWVQKKLYGRSYMGMERATFLVDAGGVIRKIWRNVKVPGHASAVLKAAQTLSNAPVKS